MSMPDSHQRQDACFARDLHTFGTATALLLPDGQAISYQALSAMCDHWVAQLRKLSIAPHQLCALPFQNQLHSVVAYLGALRAQQPLLLLDPQLSQAQQHQLLSQLPVAALFHSQGEFQILSQSQPCVRPDLAILLSTSGSTAEPKSVMLSAANLQANACSISQYLPMLKTDRAMTNLPLHYSYGLSVLNSHLLIGAAVVLSEYSLLQKEFWQLYKQYAVTSLAGVPYTYQMLQTLRFERMQLPALRYLTQAGGRLNDKQRSYIQQLAKQLEVPVFLMYGQTEATARIAFLPPEHLPLHADCIGRAIPGGKLFIRRPDHQDEITTDGVAGELCFQGPNVMLGYAKNLTDLQSSAQLTELRTGDLAERLPNGLFRIVGRLNRFLKIQGRRFGLDHLEQQLAAIQIDAICTGHDDCLYIALVPGSNTDAAVQQCHRYLQDCHLHPSFYRILNLHQIPYTSNGKIDYRQIQQQGAHDAH